MQSLRLTGWPRKFDCAQDADVARRLKPKIEDAIVFYLEQLQSPEPSYILGRIEVLESRYFEKENDPEIQKQIDREWIEDLSEYPQDLLDMACNNWRCSDQNYAPRSAGVLMESVKSEWVRRKCIYQNAEAVLRLLSLG